MKEKRPSIGCYYFPNYHSNDERNAAHHGPAWNEWRLVQGARPRFTGHLQPKVPVWGYEDEADPAVMTRKIAAAWDHGIDYFIFDYYRYDDGDFLNHCLDDGFLKAANPHPLRFALMWANNDWLDIHPCGRVPRPVLYPGRVTVETFRTMRRNIIERYFKNPAYYLLDGAPYFSIYHLQEFLSGFASVAEARSELDAFRAETRAAGFRDLHLNAVVWGSPVLPCEGVMTDQKAVVKTLGFDSVTSYVWIHHTKLGAQPTTQYDAVAEAYFAHWEKMLGEYDIPYYPNATVGWDASPRTVQSEIWEPGLRYPYTSVVVGNTPEKFRAALERCAERMRELGTTDLNINSWNEWTEGSMLEPEAQFGMGYLEAVKAVFPR